MKNDELLLNSLCDKYGSDKGSLIFNFKSDTYNGFPHNYTKVYANIFAPIKNQKLNIFECGLGTNNTNFESNMGVLGKPGASLRVWRDYFINSNIYGADIDGDVLFEEERIKTGQMDQLNNQSVVNFFDKFNNFIPDIIIDDGLHTLEAAISLHQSCFKYLVPGGIYIIEDILRSNVQALKDYLFKYTDKYELIELDIEGLNREDNIMAVIYKNHVDKTIGKEV